MFLTFLLKTTSKNHTQIIKGVLHENAGRFYVEYIPKTVYNERKIHRRLQIMRDHRNQSKKRKKYAPMIICLLVILVLVGVPLIVVVMVKYRWIITDTTNEWIGFWGGYLGALIGGALTLVGVIITIKNEEKVRKENEIRLMRPVLSGKIEILERRDIKKLKNGRGAILNIAGEQAGNGERYDNSSFEEYFKQKKNSSVKVIRYRLVNLSNYSANNVSVKVNEREGFPPFSLLPMDEAVAFFIISLSSCENEKHTELRLEFVFEDELVFCIVDI